MKITTVEDLGIQDLYTYYLSAQLLVDDVLRTARINNTPPKHEDLAVINAQKNLIYGELKNRLNSITSEKLEKENV